MWLLVATLCIQLDGASAECRKIVGVPVSEPMECRKMLRPTYDFIEQQAAEIGAPVLFLGVRCERGDDA